MKYKKFLGALLVLSFFAVIMLPLPFSDFEGGKASVNENRMLAPAPQLITDGHLTLDRAEVNDWINDNIGGRSMIQTFHDRILYTLFREHPGSFYEGKEQWRYILPYSVDAQHTNANVPDTSQLEALGDTIRNIQNTLHAHDIAFVAAAYPTKYQVYPEYMPDHLKTVSDVTPYEATVSYLQAQEDLHFVSPFDALMAAKQEQLVYWKAYDGSHWNHYGAWIAYRCLMQEVQRVLPEVRVLTEDDFVITDVVLNTDLPNGFSASEIDKSYVLKENNATADPDYLFSLGFTTVDPWHSWRYYRNADTTLPKAVIVGDSFTWMFMLDSLSQSFSELAFIHCDDMSQMNLLVNAIRPDVVIGAFLSPSIFELNQYDPVFPSEG